MKSLEVVTPILTRNKLNKQVSLKMGQKIFQTATQIESGIQPVPTELSRSLELQITSTIHEHENGY